MSELHTHRKQNKRSLKFALGITIVFFVVEAIAGILTNSLALLSDSGHMLTDVLALGMSLLAMWVAQRPATEDHTFGYHRVEILAALVNGLTLVGISIFIFIEAYHRFQNPPEVAGLPMMIVAIAGLLINILSGLILHGSKDQSLNVRGAYLHVLGDALGSVGAIIAGFIMWTTDWMYADPIFSIIIGLIIIYSSSHLLRETIHILMQGTPANIVPVDVRAAIEKIEYVSGLHDLHIWTLTNGIDALSVHVSLSKNAPTDEYDEIIRKIRKMSHKKFGIEHTTIQIEQQADEHNCVVQK